MVKSDTFIQPIITIKKQKQKQKKMTNLSRTEKLLLYNEKKLDVAKTWLLFIFLGWYYGSIGKIGKQILYYLTLGGFGFWTLYVLLTLLGGGIKKYNLSIAEQIGLSREDFITFSL